MLNFQCPFADYVVTFEDDGKTAYAYLKADQKIVSAVWLYNRCPTPTIAEWDDRRNIPFANVQNYMSEQGRMRHNVQLGDVIVDWKCERDMPIAYVYIFGDLYGVVDTDYKVGYARFATNDSPLARVMEIKDD